MNIYYKIKDFICNINRSCSLYKYTKINCLNLARSLSLQFDCSYLRGSNEKPFLPVRRLVETNRAREITEYDHKLS